MSRTRPAGAVAYAAMACAVCSTTTISVVEVGLDWEMVPWGLLVIVMLFGVWACATEEPS